MLIFKLIVAAVRLLLGKRNEEPMTDAEIDAGLAHEAARRNLANLNWKESIVDLLKVLCIDPSFGHRDHLWHELGFRDEYKGDERQNVMLIQEVRKRFASGELD